jgi:hypothetical protein
MFIYIFSSYRNDTKDNHATFAISGRTPSHSDSDWGFYRGNSKMNKFQIFQIFWAQMIDKVLIFDNSMPKDIWFHLNFNFLKVEVGCLC